MEVIGAATRRMEAIVGDSFLDEKKGNLAKEIEKKKSELEVLNAELRLLETNIKTQEELSILTTRIQEYEGEFDNMRKELSVSV